MTAKTKKAMMVGVVTKSGDGNPLLQAAEQFLTEHYSTAEAATAQWHTEGAGPWIKSYAARLSHIQGYPSSTKVKATTHTASVAAWGLPTAQEPHLTVQSNDTQGSLAMTRKQRRQRQVEYDTTAVPTDVHIGVTDVQEMAQDLNPTSESKENDKESIDAKAKDNIEKGDVVRYRGGAECEVIETHQDEGERYYTIKFADGQERQTTKTHISHKEEDPDAPGGKTYEIVAKLMRDQGLQGDPKEFIPGYYKEINTVTTLRLKPVSPEVAAYIRSKKLAVRLKMLLEVKKDNRRKGRLVLQGFRAPAWWKVGPTDSPVVATSALRALIFRRDRIHGQREILSQFDFDVAFLQADQFGADERVKHVTYRPHPGYPDEIYELTGPLYGSDDAPMRFFNTVAPWLIVMGFTQGKNDPCMFVNDKTGITVALHVDDGLVRGTTVAQAEFYADLAKRFKYKPPTYLTEDQALTYVGFTIREYRNSEGVSMRSIDCQQDTAKLVELAGIAVPDMRQVKCPMPDGSEIASDNTALGTLEATFYRSTVGQIQFLAHMVRYDVAHPISRLGQYSQSPTEGARKALVRVLGYLAKTSDFRIEGQIHGEGDKVEIYSDSDHGGDKHVTTRSHTGNLICLNGVPVHWRSAKQPVTALSSAEAEIYALSEAVKCGRLFQWRCEEMGMSMEWPMQIWVDNEQAVVFQKGTCVNSKLKGTFDMRLQWIGELKADNIVQGAKVDRENNLSDILTHCQPSGKFTKAVLQIQQHYKKFTGQNSFHTIVGNRVLSKIRSLFGSVQFRNSLHRIGVVAKRGHPPILI